MSESPARPANRWAFRLLLLLIALIVAGAALTALGIDVVGFLVEVWQNISKVPIEFLVLALVFRVLESLFTALSWWNVLRATFSDQRIRYRTVLGGYQAGMAAGTIAPAEIGTVAMISLFRVSIPGTSVPALLAAYAVQQIAFVLFGVLLYLFLLLSFPGALTTGFDAVAQAWGFITSGTTLSLVTLAVLAVLLVVAAVYVRYRYLQLRAQIQPAIAILKTPRRYLLSVFIPALLAFASRSMITVTFMTAFDIPLSPNSILLTLAAISVTGTVQVTPGGLGPRQAITVLVLRDYAPADVVVAFSLTHEFAVAVFLISIAIVTSLWAFGWTRTRELFRNRRQITTATGDTSPSDG